MECPGCFSFFRSLLTKTGCYAILFLNRCMYNTTGNTAKEVSFYMKFHSQIIKKPIAGILVICLILCSLYGLWTGICTCRTYSITPLTNSDLTALDLSSTKHLMIVAHPDDETLWGGAHLLESGYLVVCITNGTNKTRSEEFQSVMKQSGNVGLILSYPDKTAGKRDNWMHIRTQLQADLDKIITYKPWDDIVTHNAAGEYGHIHHKMTHQLVTAIYDTNELQMPLYVFGKYYRAAVLPDVKNTLTPISANALMEKEALLSLYISQTATANALSHMNPYEMWTEIRGGTQHEQKT